MAQSALADVIRLAKAATTSGSAEDVKKFQTALEYLTKMVQNLPRSFSRKLYDESSAIFNAACEISKGGLAELVNCMH